MIRIEFVQAKPRIEDWRVKLNGRAVGSVWRAGEGRYIANCTHEEPAPTAEAAFKAARKQLKSITAASR